MMKRKLAALLAAVLLGTAAVPTTVVFAQGNDPDAAAVTDAAETKAQTDEEQAGETAEVTESGGEISEEEALSEVAKLLTGNPDFFSTVIGDLDPETLEILMKNPKLLGYFLPTLHVTVTDGTVKIDYKDQETEETILTGTVTTNGSNLNVRTGPGIGYDIISSLANGSQIKVLGEKDGWYQIEFPADIAYVCGQYVRLNEVATAETPEGYSFDITGTDMAAFLSAFSSLFEGEPQVIPEVHGLTPDGNLTLVDDLGEKTGEGQQFITLVTKAGNYFYLIIDRNEKGEETVHFLNMVDERDLFSLMDEDEASALAAQMEAEKATQETAATAPATPSDQEKEPVEPEKEEKPARNMLPALIALLVLLGGGGAFAYMQLKGKKQQEAERPDPDADYEDEDMSDYDMPETEEEAEASEEEEDYSDDSDEDESE
jgi:hypothetical protein